MAKEDEALREMAANRGCRLVRSRRRKPGGDYGRYGLADPKTGKKLFGFGAAGLEATAGEIEDYLRGSAVSTWKGSLAAAGKAPKGGKAPPPSRGRRARPEEPEKPPPPPPVAPKEAERRAPSGKAAKAGPEPEPPEPPRLRIRAADSVDGEAVAALLAELGFPAEPDSVADRIQRLARLGQPPLLAKRGEEVAGCLTWHVTEVLHRPRPVGRITMLVVAASARRRGIGAALVKAAEAKLAQRGCGLVEVTSNEKLRSAHAFYKSLGYERTSYRFARPLEP
jgi:ribosomal protein S18 acetylase RimI-like enzyme